MLTVTLPRNTPKIQMAMFIQASFFMGDATAPPASNILPFNMWWTQLPIAAFFLLANFLALGEDDSRKAD